MADEQTAAGDDDDLLPARRPTSHERRAGVPWDASYDDGSAPLQGLPAWLATVERTAG